METLQKYDHWTVKLDPRVEDELWMLVQIQQNKSAAVWLQQQQAYFNKSLLGSNT